MVSVALVAFEGTEHINGFDLFFKDRDHLVEKWEAKARRNENAFPIRTDSEGVQR